MKSSVAIALVLTAYLSPIQAAEQPQGPPTAEAAAPAEKKALAQRIYFDPETGRLTNKPPLGAVPFALGPEELNAISTSQEGLVLRPAPGGGMMIDLQGRFQHMTVATVAADGTVELHEVVGGPTSTEREESEINKKE